jgi:hypothetical protein
MYVNIVPLGLIASILLSSVSARSLYSENSLVARHHSDCDDAGHGHSGEWGHGPNHGGDDDDDSGLGGDLLGGGDHDGMI